ncbi:MAG: PLP-dependent aspartate aminotransferase family protein [Thermaerobacter sp.]|jgi:cystathionine beta-lyase/cystathionine gamma-synthase|nr:PLP-dependent aspartate aminotransferase family protein [Thermaerobacter sp.]
MRTETILARLGACLERDTNALAFPIYQTATFRHRELERGDGYDYSRTSNPTRTALEEGMAALEGGARALAFASGMAAITAVLHLFRSGDHLVVTEDLYGGTYRVLTEVFRHLGLAASFVPTRDVEAVERAVRPDTRALFVETPSNPLLGVSDLRRLGRLAKKRGLMLIVDNTFLTPLRQRPLELGADLVVYSATKYLAGHNDVVAGMVVAATPQLGERLAFVQNATGGILGPQDCWLVLRGMKTLALRMERHEANARRVAAFLDVHPAVARLYFPALPDYPGKEVHDRQATGPGGVITFQLRDPLWVPRFIDRLRLVIFAESLGGTETLITYPATQTHRDVPVAERRRLGITDDLLRLSVGLEDPEDVLEDLEQALEALEEALEAVR